MHLYQLTLQKSSAIYNAVHGNFSGTKTQDIVVSRGKVLELLRPDHNTGKVHPVFATEVFGVIRDMMAFRLTGGTKGKSNFSFDRKSFHSLNVINFANKKKHYCAKETCQKNLLFTLSNFSNS